MTAPHTGPSLDAPDLDSAVDGPAGEGPAGLRRRAGSCSRRSTPPTAPISAEQIADGLAGRLPRSDLASVYRNLETLEQVGLVRHFHLGHGPGLYAPAGAAEREYLVCDSCSAVTAVERGGHGAACGRSSSERFGYEARFSHFPILGLCADCAREETIRSHPREETRA